MMEGMKMTMRGLYNAVMDLAGELTLKGDYSEELERLDAIEGCIPVLLYLNGNRGIAQNIKKEINDIREWIRQETA